MIPKMINVKTSVFPIGILLSKYDYRKNINNFHIYF